MAADPFLIVETHLLRESLDAPTAAERAVYDDVWTRYRFILEYIIAVLTETSRPMTYEQWDAMDRLADWLRIQILQELAQGLLKLKTPKGTGKAGLNFLIERGGGGGGGGGGGNGGGGGGGGGSDKSEGGWGGDSGGGDDGGDIDQDGPADAWSYEPDADGPAGTSNVSDDVIEVNGEDYWEDPSDTDPFGESQGGESLPSQTSLRWMLRQGGAPEKPDQRQLIQWIQTQGGAAWRLLDFLKGGDDDDERGGDNPRFFDDPMDRVGGDQYGRGIEDVLVRLRPLLRPGGVFGANAYEEEDGVVYGPRTGWWKPSPDDPEPGGWSKGLKKRR